MAAQYECLAGDSRVWTATRGLVPTKEIEPKGRGVRLRRGGRTIHRGTGESGVPRQVPGQTYRITAGTREIRATDNHPCSSSRMRASQGGSARFRRVWKTVAPAPAISSLCRSCRRRVYPRFPSTATVSDPSRQNSDLMWLLGFFVGAGNVQSAGRTHRVQFAVIDTDVEVRAEIERIVAEQFGLRMIHADSVRVLVESKALVEWLVETGVTGRSLTKRIPDCLPAALPSDWRSGGYVDADGYCGPQPSASVHLTSGNEAPCCKTPSSPL